jgi:hypothetical protein
MTDDPRYPIGRFNPPTSWTAEDTARWRHVIADLPASMRAAVHGLDEHQLDEPYRAGGWTVRQVVHHVADSHVNAFCRCKLTLTEDMPTIKPYREAAWAELADGKTGPVDSSLMMLDGLHARWSRLLDSFTEQDWHCEFMHPEHGTSFTLGRTVAMYAWHCEHHVAHITALRKRRGW